MKKDVRSLSLEELTTFFEQNNFPSYRARQVYDWLWKKSCFSFERMTNLSKDVKELLDKEFVINHIKIDKIQKSIDGTIKNAVKLYDNFTVESVLIPLKNRTTACVSSQVGCSLDCKFCATSKLKRIRNLNADEIFDQVSTINNQSLQYYDRPISNIVFMGMGEPLLNYKNLIQGIKKITSKDGLGISPKRITVSTSGIPKMIERLADEPMKVNLALSLHSAVETTRKKIMPFSTRFSLSEILNSLSYWYKKTKRVVTYEYIIWKGINDDYEHVKSLVSFCKKSPSKVNIIHYNDTGNEFFQPADSNRVDQYVEELKINRIAVTVRKSRGNDIDAACGQLANKITN